MNSEDYDVPRSSNARPPRKRILIVTEGEVTEPRYFGRLKEFLELQKPQLHVHVEKASDGNTPARIVSSAKEMRKIAEEEEQRLDELGALDSRSKYDEVWVVFDTEAHGKRNDLHPAAETAIASDLKVAISRPSFESWFLLHLRDGLPAMSTCAEACKEISLITKKEFRREYHKGNNEDLQWLIERILPQTSTAITRSKRIAAIACRTHPIVPDSSATMVHELVELLWKSSPKGARGR